MSCIEFNQAIECQDFGGSVPGIAKIYVVERRLLGFWYYEETDTYQYGRIIGNQLNPFWYEITCDKELTVFNQDQLNPIRRLYDMRLTVSFNGISQYYRDKLEQTALTDLVVVFRDKNGRFWCMGETSGCQVKKWNFGTGVSRTGQNITSVDFTCAERYPIREINTDVVNLCANPLCGFSLDDLCASGESLDSLCVKCSTLN